MLLVYIKGFLTMLYRNGIRYASRALYIEALNCVVLYVTCGISRLWSTVQGARVILATEDMQAKRVTGSPTRIYYKPYIYYR